MKTNIMFHEQFLSEAHHLIEAIKDLKSKGNIKESLQKSLELCYLKVNYYGQFIDLYPDSSKAYWGYQDSYSTALRELSNVRDKCMDAGVYEN